MQKALRVRLSSTALLMIGFFFLVLIVVMTFRLAQRTQEELAAGILARDVATASVELRSGLLAAESSQRGFLANGNEIYLAPFSTAKTRSFRQLDTLKDLLAPDASAQKVLERLDTLVHEKFVELDQTIALKREGRNEEAMAILRSNTGKALMDEANVFLSSIVRRANDALAVNFAEQN